MEDLRFLILLSQVTTLDIAIIISLSTLMKKSAHTKIVRTNHAMMIIKSYTVLHKHLPQLL
jgi:hypothetical protein